MHYANSNRQQRGPKMALNKFECKIFTFGSSNHPLLLLQQSQEYLPENFHAQTEPNVSVQKSIWLGSSDKGQSVKNISTHC